MGDQAPFFLPHQRLFCIKAILPESLIAEGFLCQPHYAYRVYKAVQNVCNAKLGCSSMTSDKHVDILTVTEVTSLELSCLAVCRLWRYWCATYQSIIEMRFSAENAK